MTFSTVIYRRNMRRRHGSKVRHVSISAGCPTHRFVPTTLCSTLSPPPLCIELSLDSTRPEQACRGTVKLGPEAQQSLCMLTQREPLRLVSASPVTFNFVHSLRNTDKPNGANTQKAKPASSNQRGRGSNQANGSSSNSASNWQTTIRKSLPSIELHPLILLRVSDRLTDPTKPEDANAVRRLGEDVRNAGTNG
jgi:hypothetical protein